MTEPPEQEPMNDMRRVLYFLKCNPESSIDQIYKGADLTKQEVATMIKKELRLVTSKSEDGATTLYSLPKRTGPTACCGGACSRGVSRR
jgi:hypothetical protein